METWNINISNLEKELQQAILEFDCFVQSENGICVWAEKNDKEIGYEKKEEGIVVRYDNKARFLYLLFVALVHKEEKSMVLQPGFESLLVLLDLSRNAVKTVEALKKFMRHMVLMGYDCIQLYIEDVYHIPEEPYWGYKRGKYSHQELREIVQYGNLIGIEVMPSIQTLGHLATALHWLTYDPIHDAQGILLADDERTYELIENMFRSLRQCFTTERIHVGMDEAHWIGLGKYLDKHGFTDRVSIVVKHIQKVYDLALKYGFTEPIICNDMFLRLVNHGKFGDAEQVPEEILDMLPPHVSLLCWNYYRFDEEFYRRMFNIQRKFNREVYYVGGAGSWFGVTPQNRFAIKQTAVAMKVCKEMKIKNYIVGSFGDDGAVCSPFACLPAFAYAGSLANNVDHKRMFKAMTGIEFEDFLTLDLPNEVSEKSVALIEPSKQALFNDPLYGLLDCIVKDGDSKVFSGYIQDINPMTQDATWGYLFQTQQALLRILDIKYDLGVRTRRAYHESKDALAKLLPEYDTLSVLISEYYEALRTQWYTENKRYGFEVQDYRIGGLKCRIDNVRRTLSEYITGNEEVFEELEEGILNIMCDESINGMGVDYRLHRRIASANVM